MDVTRPVSRRTMLVGTAAAGAALSIDALAPRSTSARRSAANTVTISLFKEANATQNALYKRVFDGFHAKYPNIQVKVTDVAGNIDATVIPTRGVSGSLPDVWYNRTYETADRANRGWTLPLNTYAKRDAATVKMSDFWQAEVAQETWKGQLHSLPTEWSDFAIYYNKTLFDQKGIKYPPADGNWTWDDLHNLAKEFVASSGGKQVTWGIDISALAFAWPVVGFLLAWGGKWLSTDLRTCMINTPEAQQVLQMFQDMVFKTHVAPRAGAVPAGFDPWSTGHLAMAFGGSWAPLYYRTIIGNRFKWDIAPLPKGPTGRRPISPAGGAWSIAATSKHPDEAWELVKWLTNTQTEEIMFSQTVADIPSRKSAIPLYNKVATAGNLPPVHVVDFNKYMDEAFTIPAVPYYDQFAAITGNYVSGLLSSNRPVKDTIASWQQAVQTAIKQTKF